MAFVVLAIVVWIAIAVGANARAPGVVGLAATVFGGLSAAVLTVAVGGWVALKLAGPESVATSAIADPSDIDAGITAAMRELTTVQQPIQRRMVDAAAWRMPACAAIGAAIWSALVLLGAPGGVMDFSAVLLGSGLAGYGWALVEARRKLNRAWLQRGIGTLASTQGGLSWIPAPVIDHRRLQSEGVLPPSESVRTFGQIAGSHQGVALSIASLQTKPAAGSSGAGTSFNGLVIELDAPHLSATSMEDLAAQYPQLAVRIGRLPALPGLGAPRSAASGSRVSIAIFEIAKPRLFEAPAQANAKTAAARLSRIRQLIAAVRGIAETLASPPGTPPA